ATEPFGFGRVFPRGMLREPIEGLSRADVVCLTRSDLVDSCSRTRTRDEAMRLAPDAIWCEASHEPARLITAKGDQRSLAELQGRRVAAFCGIGNPAAFRRTLEAAGCDVASWRPFPDHHRFSAVDEQEIEQLADRSDAELVVCTHKDLVKVRAAGGLQEKLAAVVVEMTFLSGQDAFTAKLDQTIAARMQQG
ncbi:MAG: tetraacyldisaccharide 4'-kinase, partial [Planctomycetota bacterium]